MKHLLLLAVVLAMATTAFGAPCTSYTVAAPSSCSIGDKVFDPFTSTAFPAGTMLEIVSSDPQTYTVTFTNGNGFKSPFSFAYTVSVDTTVCPSCVITEVDAGVTGGRGTTANMVTSVTPGAPSPVTSTRASGSQAVFVPSATTVMVSNTYSGANASNYVTTLSNTIIQGTPEPLSLGLTGLGLAVFGFVGRRKFAR
jgi:hypothetical protein